LLKASENPPAIWPEDKTIADFRGLWRVAHTKSRNEKALAHDLIIRGVSYFLPMRYKLRYIRGRKIKSLLPLFSGYLFFCGNEKQRVEVLKTNRVANLIEVSDQQNLIEELCKIEQAIKAGVQLKPHKYVRANQRCRVNSGPLRGLEGIIQKIPAATRLILQVDILGQAASVEVDTDIIELLD